MVIDKSLEEYEEVCKSQRNIFETISITIGACSIFWGCLVVSYFLFIYRYRIQIHCYRAYSYFLTSYCCQRLCKVSPPSANKMEYDIYISYSDRDHTFVFDTLLEWLENRYGFKCNLQGLFLFGEDILDSVIAGMKSSQVILVVVSKTYDPDFDFEARVVRELETNPRYAKKIIYIMLEQPSRDSPLGRYLDISHSKMDLPWTYNSDSRQIPKDKAKAFMEKLKSKILKHIYPIGIDRDIDNGGTPMNPVETNANETQSVIGDSDNRGTPMNTFEATANETQIKIGDNIGLLYNEF